MDLANVVKLKLNIDDDTGLAFYETAYQYMLACNDVSQYVFDHDFELNSVTLSKILYKHNVRLEIPDGSVCNPHCYSEV